METITCASGQTPDPDWKKDFLILCADICGVEDSRNPFKGFRTRAACPYCGKAFEVQASGTLRQEYQMCQDCRRRIIKDQNQLQRLVRETEKNVALLFGIRLKNKLPARKLARSQQSRNVKKGEPAKAPQPSGFCIKKTKKGEAEACLWGRLPDAVVAGEVVRYICESHFTEICAGWEGNAGAAQWMRVRYLRIMDLEEYAAVAEQSVCQSETGAYGYAFWDSILRDAPSREIPARVKAEGPKKRAEAPETNSDHPRPDMPADEPERPKPEAPEERSEDPEPKPAADDSSPDPDETVV